jgi:hypothetical protein
VVPVSQGREQARPVQGPRPQSAADPRSR